MIELDQVERALDRLWIDADGASLRREERKKAIEVRALLDEIARARASRGPLVDAAAGKAYVGLLAAELAGARHVIVIEREPARVEAARRAAEKIEGARVELVVGDAGDASLYPEGSLVVALHACGPASDAILDAAIASKAKRLLLVPCCYGAGVPFVEEALARAEELGVPRHAEARRRFVIALVDAERTLRLEAAGYETTLAPLVPPTVTPHNVVFRARRALEPVRMRDAAERLARLRGGAV